jgi:hypothetical protein
MRPNPNVPLHRAPRSAFAGYRFLLEVITLAIRWYFVRTSSTRPCAQLPSSSPPANATRLFTGSVMGSVRSKPSPSRSGASSAISNPSSIPPLGGRRDEKQLAIEQRALRRVSSGREARTPGHDTHACIVVFAILFVLTKDIEWTMVPTRWWPRGLRQPVRVRAFYGRPACGTSTRAVRT